jgi:hypothetical protein
LIHLENLVAAVSATGYWPAGKIACCGVAPGSSGVAGTPHEYAAGPAGELLAGVGNGGVAAVWPPRCAKASPEMTSATFPYSRRIIALSSEGR